MQKILSPNQFLFEQSVLEVLKQAKKIIRIAPFQNIDPDELVKQNNGNLHLNLYHQYFISAMTNTKTKQLSCLRYDKILRQNLFQASHLPCQMISSILGACSSIGASTTGSSHGSTNISTNQQAQCPYLINLIKTILIKTQQNSFQIQVGLTYILQGTRNKRFSGFYVSVLEEVYNALLVKIRDQPLKRIIKLQLNHWIDQVQYHFHEKHFNFQNWNRSNHTNKPNLCLHDHRPLKGVGKFGKCFCCSKQADNYCKDQLVPVCSFDCKNKLKSLIQSQNNKDHFDLLGWLLQNLPSGDQIIYSFLGRQLPHHILSLDNIIVILKCIIPIFTTCVQQKLTLHTQSLQQGLNQPVYYNNFKMIEKHALNIFLHILFNYKTLYEEELSKYFKVFLFQIVRILELIPIKRVKQKLQHKGSKGELSSKQSLQSSISLDTMTMVSLSSFNQPNFPTTLTHQQQFSNPFLNGLIQILSNQDYFFYIYSKFDCKLFQVNLLKKMINIISQYAKEEIASKQAGITVTGSSAYGIFSILKMLTDRLVGYQNHKNLRNLNLKQENRKIQQFLTKYPVNTKQIQLKRQLVQIIQLFNKKPNKGIIALKKLFSKSKNLEPQKQQKIQQKCQQKEQINLQTNEYEKDVQQIKKKAQKLQQQTLQLSRISLKQSIKNLSIQQISQQKHQKQVKHQRQEKVEDISISQQKQEKVEEQSPIKKANISEQAIQISQKQVKQVSQKQVKQVSQRQVKEVSQKQVKKVSKTQMKPIQQKQSVSISEKSVINNKKQSQKQIIVNNDDSLITNRQIAILIRQNVDYQSKLKKIPLFNKQKIGQFFGSTKFKGNEICFQFFKLDQHIYSSFELDDCLRTQFNYFGLPKQGQQIQNVIDQLSKAMISHTYFTNPLHIFQYIYTLLMVQSGHNPNVKENDKVKLQMFLSMVSHIDDVKDKAERDFYRIKRNSLNNLVNWGENVFQGKYLMHTEKEDYLFQLLKQKQQKQHKQQRSKQQQNQSKQQQNQSKQQQNQSKQQQNQSKQQLKQHHQVQYQQKLKNQVQQSHKQIINVKYLLQYIWEYVYISIVNNQKKNNTLGVFQAIVLYGKYNLVGQQFGFIQIFKRSYEHTKSKQSLESLLRLGIQFNNYMFQWSYIISLSYSLQQSNIYHQHIDKIFTNLQYVDKSKLKLFLSSLCQFSTSQYKSDKLYTRELFVLRHMAQILEYNLFRLQEIFVQIWCLIQSYFKIMCLHPRKQISMSSIDSYKQLSLKIFKQKANIQHEKILALYLYIFERSNVTGKDFIVNVLLNVVGKDVKQGWNVVYQILMVNDSQDRTVVMKVVERLVQDVGYNKLTHLNMLHHILVKQLRVNVNTPTLISSILNRLWEVSQVLNTRQVWIQTLRSIKDIYKMSLNNKLLILFFKICNRCISNDPSQVQQRKRKQSLDQMRPLIKVAKIQQQTKLIEQKQIKQQISIDRQIYTQLVDWLIFLIDNKHSNLETTQKYILILRQALQFFKTININYIIRYLVGVSGLLKVFTMLISSNYKIVFLLFFKDFFINKLISHEYKIIHQSPTTYVELIGWLKQHFKQSKPSDLLAMKKLDQDFKKQRKNILQDDHASGTQIIIANNQTHKIELIQFSLSAQDFNIKAISNLILLDCIQKIVNNQSVSIFYDVLNKIKQTKQQEFEQNMDMIEKTFQINLKQLTNALKQNFKISRKTNNLIVLRNFLWNNGFLLYNTYQQHNIIKIQKIQQQINIQQTNTNNNQLINIMDDQSKVMNLPGLHKHQKRTLQLIFNSLKAQDIYQLNIQIIQDFISNYKLKAYLQEERTSKNGLKKRKNTQQTTRIRKISEVIRKIDEQQPINNKDKQQQSKLQKSKANQQQVVCFNKKTTKQQQVIQLNKKTTKQEQISPLNKKTIKVIQFDKKVIKKSKVAHINKQKSQKSNQTQSFIKKLYLNDINEWLKMMQQNLKKALNNLYSLCSHTLNQRKRQKDGQIVQNNQFTINDQQILKIYLLCLDLCAQDNSPLSIIRFSSTLMQKLLKVVMELQIDYGQQQQEIKDNITQ